MISRPGNAEKGRTTPSLLTASWTRWDGRSRRRSILHPSCDAPESLGISRDRRSADVMLIDSGRAERDPPNRGSRDAVTRRASLYGVVAFAGILSVFVVSAMAAPIPSDVKKAVALVFRSEERGEPALDRSGNPV